MKSYTHAEVTKLPGSIIEIKAKVSAKELESHREHVIEHIASHVEIPGFRKGNAPKDLVVEKIGEGKVLEEIAEHVISEVYPEIITKEKLAVIDRPTIVVEKLDPKEGLEFTAKVQVFPDFTLPQYKKIAKEVTGKETEELKISDEEVNKAIEEIKKALNIEGDLTDEAIKKIGAFDNLVEFTKKLKENLLEEKKSRAKDKKRAEIMEAILKDVEIDLPQILIDSEIEKMLLQFKDDLTRMGTTLPDYLKKIEKTEKEVRADWKDTASKRVKSQIVINRIGEEEKITANEKELEAQVKHILETYPEANPERAKNYVETMMINDAVLAFLEK